MEGDKSQDIPVVPNQVWTSPAPVQGWSGPPPAYTESVVQPVVTQVVHVPGPGWGDQPVTTVCTNCHVQMTTITTTETGVMAWVLAGLMCAVGMWLCAPIPLCVDSLQDTTHRCPLCGVVVARCKGSL